MEVGVRVVRQRGVYGQVCGGVDRKSDLVKAFRWPIHAFNGTAGDAPIQGEGAVFPL